MVESLQKHYSPSAHADKGRYCKLSRGVCSYGGAEPNLWLRWKDWYGYNRLVKLFSEIIYRRKEDMVVDSAALTACRSII